MMTETTTSLVDEFVDMCNQGVSLVNWFLDFADNMITTVQDSYVMEFFQIIGGSHVPVLLAAVVTLYMIASFFDYVRGR